MIGTSLLTAVLRALDLCIVERLVAEGPALRLVTGATVWLSSVFETVPPEPGQILGAPIPFLDHFLSQAEAAWHEGQEPVTSGFFTSTFEGDELLLQATATLHYGRRLLILRSLNGDADLRPTLQRAREQVLEQERVVRQIGALHAPSASIDRDARTLVAASLAADHHAVAARLSQASAEVQALLATLPSPPSRLRRKARPK